MVNIDPRCALIFVFASALAASEGAALAGPREPSKTAGKSQFEKGSKYFEAEEYEAALPHFLEAYELSGKRPATIFSLAQCERALKMYDRAIEHFQEYLTADDDSERAQEVKETLELLRELKARVDREAEAAAQTKAAEEEQRAQEQAARQASAAQDAERAKELANQPAVNQPAANQPAANQPAANQPAANQPAATQPAKERANEPTEREDAEQRARVLIEQPRAERVAPDALSPPPPVVTAAPPHREAEPETDSIFSSPWFWVIAGAVVAGGATTATLLVGSGSEPYAGTTGVILQPKD